MIVDIVTYNGEKDLFDLRYNILKDYVDEFIMVEFDKTFSGKPKSVLWEYNKKYDNVLHYTVEEEEYNKYLDLAKSSPNTEYGKGAEHWIREFCQKESIKDCLTHLQDNDTVVIGDCDEIWRPPVPIRPSKLELLVYSYYLNQRSSEQFYGPIVVPYGYLKDRTLNHLRTEMPKLSGFQGWHFTSMGGYNQVKQKLEDSYTSDSYANPQVMANLEENIKQDKDFLGRNFTYWLDESDWPQYLKDHRELYQHLMK